MIAASPAAVLTGLGPQPLANYLASLGVLRICATQLQPDVRAAFGPRGFVLSGVAEDALVELLVDRWVPSPIVAPWNNASGFHPSSKGQLAAGAMNAILASSLPRLRELQGVIRQVRMMVAKRGYDAAPKDEDKASFITELRNVLPDAAIAWLDAAAVIDGADARMMPMLGSGGNEGVLDYSGLFLRSLVEMLLGDRARSVTLLRAALFGRTTSDLVEGAVGQFDPGTAGGFNTGPGFESKELPNNPWRVLLLFEGALVWTSGIASRQAGLDSTYRFAVSPFTVRHRAAGYGSAGSRDDDPQRVRAELWVPVWSRPASLPEVCSLIGEGRLSTHHGGRETRANDTLDAVDAIASLGVDRGVQSFVRYAFMKRRGDAFIALPTTELDVHYRCEVDLLRQLDVDLDVVGRFMSRFPSEEGAPASLVGLRRAVDDARYDVATRGGPETMGRLVRTIGSLEMALSRRDPAKDPRLPRPLGSLSDSWGDACGDAAEVRIAASLASIVGGAGVPGIRSYLAPLDPSDPRRYAASARHVAWSGRSFADRLANVLYRRVLDAGASAGPRAHTPVAARSASLDDVAAFIAGDLDDRVIEETLFGFTWVSRWTYELPALAPKRQLPLPRTYALLALLYGASAAVTRSLGDDERQADVVADPSIVPLLRSGRISDAVDLAARQLRAKGLRPRTTTPNRFVDARRGERLAAALLIPIHEAFVVRDAALLPATQDPYAKELDDAG